MFSVTVLVEPHTFGEMFGRILEVHPDVDQMRDVLELMKAQRAADRLENARLRFRVYDEYDVIEAFYVCSSADDGDVSEKHVAAVFLHLRAYGLAVFNFGRTVYVHWVFIRQYGL